MRQHVGNSDQIDSSVALLVGACSCRWLEQRRGTTRRGEWAARSETRGRTRSTRPRGGTATGRHETGRDETAWEGAEPQSARRSAKRTSRTPARTRTQMSRAGRCGAVQCAFRRTPRPQSCLVFCVCCAVLSACVWTWMPEATRPQPQSAIHKQSRA